MSSERERTGGMAPSFFLCMFSILRRVTILSLVLPAGALSQDRSWLHVEVDQPAEERNVRVRLPLAVVETLSESMQDELFEPVVEALGRNGKNGELRMEQYRALWRSLRENPGAVVEIREGEAEGLVARMDGAQVRIEGAGEDGEVHVTLPVELGDAFLADEPDPAALAAAVRQLGEREGDLVAVESEETRVRIWVGPAQ